MSKIAPPVAPPEPVMGVPGPTFVACDGYVWRRSMQGWDTVPMVNAVPLLAGFREDQANTADWFHTRAAELADELSRAIRSAKRQRNRAANLAQTERKAA